MSDEKGTPVIDISFSEALIKALLGRFFKDDREIQHIIKQKMVGGTVIHVEDSPEGNIVRFFFREVEPRLVVPVGLDYDSVGGEPV